MGLELRKDFIVIHIVFTTNVFSCVGVSSWDFFILWNLYGSRIMDHKTVLAVGRGRESNRDSFNDEGLWGSSTLFSRRL